MKSRFRLRQVACLWKTVMEELLNTLWTSLKMSWIESKITWSRLFIILALIDSFSKDYFISEVVLESSR